MRKIADLHCDTLIRDMFFPISADALDSSECHIALSKISGEDRRLQAYAIFILDDLRGDKAVDFYESTLAKFHASLKTHEDKVCAVKTAKEAEKAFSAGKAAALLTVEGGSVLAGDIKRVGRIYEDGVRMLTLTWNGKNELASGWDTEEGFSAFGRQAVKEMERLHMIADVSHLNDKGFWELCEFARRPFAASHSNARSVCAHKRNLTDEQIRQIVQRKGLIGLNFCKNFLNDDGSKAGMEDIFAHAEKILELGGSDVLALGSDYDGTDVPPCLDSCEKEYDIGDMLLKKGYSQQLVQKIMYLNAYEFLERNL